MTEAVEMLQSPLAAALYAGAAALTAWGAARERRAPPLLGGLLWAAGTVHALVEGAGLEGALLAALALALIAAAPGNKGGAGP